MADLNGGVRYADFPAEPTYGGRFVKHNIFGNEFEITSKYVPPIMPIGRGAYGIVCSMLNSETNEMVAMKKIMNAFDNYMDAKRTLREIKLLRHLDHENVVALKDVVPPPLRREFSDVYIATELMDTDVHQIIRSNQNLSEEHCQYFLYQLLRGLKYIHSANIIHRDLKPSNLLLNANCDLKICDFGLARPNAENDFMTEYVVTRWYRAPELLLNSSEYSAEIDVWSVGCIYMELMNRKPLFAGKDHVHQMRLLTELLGTPTEADLGFIKSEDAMRYLSQLPRHPRKSLLKTFPHVNPSAIDLVEKMLSFDPAKRITVDVFDNGLRSAVEDIVTCGGPFFGDFQWRVASLPFRYGGLGLLSAKDVSSYAFVASRVQSWELQDHILRNSGVSSLDPDYGQALGRLHASLPDFDFDGFTSKDTAPPKPQETLASALYCKISQNLGMDFGLSPRQKAVMECLQQPHTQDFLTVIPIEGLGQHMSPIEYRAILKYRLMIPLFPVDEPCPVCHKVALDKFGEHAVHCKELPGFKYRHDLVRDVLFDVLRRAGISAKKEAPVNFLTDPTEGRSSLRPADVLVFGWSGGKHACVDLTGVSPLVDLRGNGFTAGQAVMKAEIKKVDKHDKACSENQHVFVPFAFDTFGSLAHEAVRFLDRVRKIVRSNISAPRGHDYVFSRIGFAIQKGVAAQLVARLPTTLM